MSEESKFTTLIYKLEVLGLKILEKIFIFLGIDIAEFLFSLLFVIFGPLTKPSFLAMRNLKLVFPKLNFFKRFLIVLGMWNNLARNLVEFVCFNKMDFKKFINYVSMDKETLTILKSFKNSISGNLIFTAHFGNWEIYPQIFSGLKIPFSGVYREMNNKFADEFVQKYRNKKFIDFIPKGKNGIFKLARNLREGKEILMLVDQKLNNGITVPFLGVPSKTTDSVATFALKHNYNVYSAVVFRKSFSSSFNLEIRKFEVINTGNLQKDIIDTTIKINETIGEWIKQKPEQWFWVHNRWKSK